GPRPAWVTEKGQLTPEAAARFVVTKPERTCDLDDVAGHLYAFAPDGRTFVNDFAETGPDGKVVRSGLRVIDTQTGQVTKTLVRVDGRFQRVAVSADLARAFTLGGDGTARVWDLATGRAVWTKTLSAERPALNPPVPGSASNARFSPDGRSVYVVDFRPEPPSA